MAQIIVRKENFNEIIDFLEFLKKLGIDEVRVIEIYPCGGNIGKKKSLLTDEQRKKLKQLHFIADKTKYLPKVTTYNFIESEKYLGCMAGYNTLYIDANGEVCPCDVTPISFGNLKKEDFETIWKRLKQVFPKPTTRCFMLKYAEEIKKKFKGKLPLSYKDFSEIFKNHDAGVVADYYKLISDYF